MSSSQVGEGNSLMPGTARPGWVAGTDGGQTKTVTVLADTQGRALAAGWSGPANHINEPGGPERCRRAVLSALQAAQAAYERRNGNRLNPPTLLAAAYGMSGGNLRMAEIIRSVVQAERQVVVVHDSMNAWMGALAGREGVIVIGGTGSVGYGRDRQGREATSGGWGHLMGDEGSGYWLAGQGLTAATQAADGRGPATLLTELLPQLAGKHTLGELHDWIYGEATRPEYAGLGRAVALAAAQGDKVAQGILAQAGRLLGELAVAVIQRLWPGSGASASSSPEPILVSYAGGVFAAGATVLDAFRQAVTTAVPAAQVVTPRLPPVGGSLLLAYQSLGVPITETLLANLEQTLPTVVSPSSSPATSMG
ncbi:MAG: hypothetical protein IMX01_03505 [Limnochordaceae bacterium]|nr:hypothetical protein [Limnochordaceae bacterium]